MRQRQRRTPEEKNTARPMRGANNFGRKIEETEKQQIEWDVFSFDQTPAKFIVLL